MTLKLTDDLVAGLPIDIIVPVYNSPEWLRACLTSIAQNTDLEYRLIIVDDASDPYTRKLIEHLSEAHENFLLVRNERNLGFVKSCNIGMNESHGTYRVLLNSDAIVPPRWLGRLVACAESDPRIGVVNPLSNEAANISIPLAPGCNYLGMDKGLSTSRNPQYPNVVTAIGFCLLLRKQMLDEIGIFDEIFGSGYCEETDLCLRAMKAGWRVVVCDNLYVFHRGSGSFDDRDERYRKNVKIFFQRHGALYRKAYREFVKEAPLSAILAQVSESPEAIWRRWISTGHVVARDLSEYHPLRAWRHFKEKRLTDQFHNNAARYRSFWRLKRPTVTFLFESLGSYGGVVSVLKLVNGLIENGFEVRVACLNSGTGLIRGLYTQPLYFSSVECLIDGVAASDIFISTYWLTAYWLPRLRERFPDARYVSYIQDFESWFEPGSSDWAAKVIESYQIPDTILTTSDWLRGKLLECGRDSFVIPKGVDGDVFRLRETEIRKPTGILGMARPNTPYRGFQQLIKIFHQLYKQEPKISLSVFGCKKRDLGAVEFPLENYGVVENGPLLAQIYNRHTVYVDPSKFQGFGMMGLEAMACGCACVLTGVGGINQYAKDRSNSLLFDPEDSDLAVELILELLRDEQFRAKTMKHGFETAAVFTLCREVDLFAEFLQAECGISGSDKPRLSDEFARRSAAQ